MADAITRCNQGAFTLVETMWRLRILHLQIRNILYDRTPYA